jgi:choline dehydrogenase-like flavoprotein
LIQHFESDVLVVGAGPAGACVTWSLAKAGLNVICIEQGEWVDANQLPSTKSNWELERFGKFSPNPNVRAGKAFGVIDDRNSPISIANFNAVGGSSSIRFLFKVT